jgi:hypothetical protein
MLALTDYGADAWSGLLVGVGTLPSSWYIALLIGDQQPDSGVDGTSLAGYEPVDGVYTRMPIGTGSTNWSGPSGGVMSSIPLIQFPAASIAWGKVLGLALCDASTAGNVWATGLLDVPTYVDILGVFIIGPGQLAFGLTSISDGSAG